MPFTQHPELSELQDDIKKWRLILRGGRLFKEEYLIEREDEPDFQSRSDVTPIPGFAKEAIREVEKSIYQRIATVQRTGGNSTFPNVAKGLTGGVDRRGSTMTAFLASKVITELLFIGKVGVYVDMVSQLGPTKAAVPADAHPYFYSYKREDIIDWEVFDNDPKQFRYIILRDSVTLYKEEIRDSQVDRFRKIWINELGTVSVLFYNNEDQPVNQDMTPNESATPIPLALTRIPFVLFELDQPLTDDIADHQIALLNLESSDISYAINSNIPFYVEQRDALSDDVYARKNKFWPTNADGTPVDEADLVNDQKKKFQRDGREVRVGVTQGRTYGPKFEAPQFIHPSPEPLTVSMLKQDRLKNDIRRLVMLAIENVGTKYQSSQTKSLDFAPLEAGLSYFGLLLQTGENELASIYALYEGKEPATVIYPAAYKLLSDTERREAAKEESELASAIPSATFRIEMQKKVATTLLQPTVDQSILDAIYDEIDSAEGSTGDPDQIRSDVEAGLVTAATGSILRGYAPGEAEKAQLERAERLRLQQQAQTAPSAEQAADPLILKEKDRAAKEAANAQ